MTSNSITSGQESQIVDLTSHAVRAALKQLGLSKDRAQKIIARGGDFQTALIPQLVQLLGSLTGKSDLESAGRRWREEDGVIYFSVTSNGKSGEEWIEYLEGKKFSVGKYAKSVLRSPDFKPTSGVTTEIAVLKGILFADQARITSNIRYEADRRKFTKLNAEIACLIRDKFTDKEIEAMGLLAIIAMHDPIKDSDGALDLLSANRFLSGRKLLTFSGSPGSRWGCEDGFAFRRVSN